MVAGLAILAFSSLVRCCLKEVATANTLSLISAQSALDSRLVKMQETAVAVIRDQRFRDFARVRNTEQERYWKVNQIITQLANYRASSMNLDILIYFPTLNYAITHEAAYTLGLLSDSLYYAKNANITARGWQEAMLGAEPNTFRVSSELSYTRYGVDALVFSASLSELYQPGCYEAKVFVSMEPGEVLPDIALRDESAFLLLSREGDVLFTRRPEFAGTRLSMEDSGYQVLTVNGEKYACVSRPSDTADLVYAVVTPYHLFWSSGYTINTIMVIGLVTASVMGVIVSLRLLIMNYSPLRSTLESLPDGGDEGKDEFGRINEQLALLYNAQNAMQVDLSRQQQYIKEYYLGMLLQGSPASLSDDDIIESLELDLMDKRLVPVFISVENEEDWAAMQGGYKDTDAGRKSVSLSSAIENVLRERLPVGVETLKTRSEDMIIVVCILPPGGSADDAAAARVEEALEEVCAYFHENLKMSLRAVIGTEARSMEDLPAVYRQVFPLRSLHTGGEGRVVRAAHYVMPASPLVSRAESFLSLLCDAVRLRSAGDAHDILLMLFRELEASGEPFTIKRYLLFELASRLYGVTGRPLLVPHMERMAQMNTPGDLHEAFESYVLMLCHPEDGEKSEPEQCGRVRLHLRVQAYVREHYADPNLSLAQIAHSVGMSPQYVSKLYKLETGQGLLDFINTVRIARAKEVLAEEQIAISTLALRVGYTNARTFRRAFQKIEGVNPGMYKT